MAVISLLNFDIPPVRRDGRHRDQIADLKVPHAACDRLDPRNALMPENQVVGLFGTAPVDRVDIRAAGRHNHRL